ncbi:MAG: ABC transporter ATP-binding protein [Velocimicrobium sp.]
MKNDYFLYTDHLTVGYQGKALVEELDIHIKKGEILAMIGPNGAGKSTILKTITKYLKEIKGTILIDSSDIKKMTNKEFSTKTSIVFTEKIKTELMTCKDVVATGRYPYTGRMGILTREDHNKVSEAMELVHITKLMDCDYTRISDGQRQRVLLARAICQEPQLIVLDEPTSFLDIYYKLELLEIIKKLANEKKIAVFMSIHELDLAQKIADYVLCIKDGRVLQYGKPEDIFKEEVIQKLYNLNNGSYNPLFGSLEMNHTVGTPKVFVIAGGGSGITTYRKLQQKGIPFITGILHENDIDYQVAKNLANAVIVEESFEPISDTVYEKAKAAIRNCDYILNCLKQLGTMNKRNLELLQAAEQSGLKQVYTIDEMNGIIFESKIE